MKAVYLDNAATTPMAKEVADAMQPYLYEFFGNPSSTHSFGRQAKGAVELARRTISKQLRCKPSEIIFTSGGTEADNIALYSSIVDHGVKRIITSPLEHHAVGHAADKLAKQFNISCVLLDVDEQGRIHIAQLKELLKENIPTLVSLMHANNEIGTLIDIKEIGSLCKEYGALFHTDTVQTMCHIPLNLEELPVDYCTAAAHKFHGPKGSGFLFKRDHLKLTPLISGGGQERELRAGTEAVHGLVGLAKAFEMGHNDMSAHQKHVEEIRSYFKEELLKINPDIGFNGDQENYLYTVLSVRFPKFENQDILLFSLDLNGVAASGGSACSSGSNIGSHVLTACGVPSDQVSVRFSFSRYTTKEEVNQALKVIKDILG